MSKIKVALVDDHHILRDGITALFENNGSIELKHSYSSGEELLRVLESRHYDVVLLDMHMPGMNGIETATEILAHFPKVKVLINTMSEVIDEVEQVVRLGAHGYILKTADYKELCAAIQVVAHGSSYFSSKVMNTFIKNSLGTSEKPLVGLSQEDMEVLAYLCDESLSIRDIAYKLTLPEADLLNTIGRIKTHLNLRSDIALGKFCNKHCAEISQHKKNRQSV